jgi:hypothetical protein
MSAPMPAPQVLATLGAATGTAPARASTTGARSGSAGGADVDWERSLDAMAGELAKLDQPLPARIDADPEKVEQGLAKLVLTLIELIRKLMERQALRRIEGGRLTAEEVERLGLTFMRLEERMRELQIAFGLQDEDLNLNLGPLGDLM